LSRGGGVLSLERGEARQKKKEKRSGERRIREMPGLHHNRGIPIFPTATLFWREGRRRPAMTEMTIIDLKTIDFRNTQNHYIE
jgi:hypothetical protein